MFGKQQRDDGAPPVNVEAVRLVVTVIRPVVPASRLDSGGEQFVVEAISLVAGALDLVNGAISLVVERINLDNDALRFVAT